MIKRKLKSIKKRLQRLFYSEVEKRRELVGPPKLWNMKQDFQIEFLKKHGLKKSSTLLDIGCGILRGGVPIIDFLDSGKYYGIEVREDVLEEGKKELKAHNLEHKNPRLINFNDFKELDLNDKFEIIFSFSVLIHMEDSITEKCIQFVSKHLSENGVFYANINEGNRKDGDWQGFPLVTRSLDFYRNLCGKYGLTFDTLGNLLELGHNSGSPSQDAQIMLKIKLA